jgi:hypothetical protein
MTPRQRLGMSADLVWIMSFLALTQAPTPVPNYTPTASYRRMSDSQEFTVLVNPVILAHEKDAEDVLREMKSQLVNIVAVIPPDRLAELRKVPIWMEWDEDPKGLGEYHWGDQWLRENGRNPEKARAVEITNARNFVAWSRDEQPWSLLHELAHGYHARVLGVDHPGIRNAYENAMRTGLYDRVKRVHHVDEKEAYAKQNEREYFAEMSEAYFGKNDFFPFNRAELKQHDPVGFQLMEKVWGTPRD